MPRGLLKWCWMCCVAVGALSAIGGLSAVANERLRPNVVFVMADDLGWGDVGWHGGNVATPHLDALAKGSLELTQHYVAPVCSPTRTGLLTGRCWSRFGVTTPQNQRALPWPTVTLATALGATGYQTALIGKWHLGSLPAEGPQRFGFDHAYGSLAGGVSPWNHRYKQGPFSQTWHRNGEWVDEPGHVTDLLAAEAVRWIESRDEQPFFLYVPFTAVHLPVKEPPEWVARVPDSIRGDVARHYAASILHLDDAVGKILDALTRKSLRDNTLFVFTSDNGGSTAENNDLQYPADDCPDGRLPGNNLPLRGQKGELYEGGTRVPTLVAWPGKITPGQTATPVGIIDWLPTFAALAGYRPETDLRWDGVDLTGILTRGEPLAPRPLYAVGPSARSRSLRLGDWKLIVTGELSSPRQLALFRIDIDPSEKTDLAHAEPAEANRLLEVMRQVALRDNDAKVQ